MRTKYAKEIGKSLRPNAMFSVSAYFTVAKADNDQRPLTVYDDRYSRFAITMVDGIKDKNKQVVNGNIPVDYIEDVLARSKYAFDSEMASKLAPQAKTASEGGNSPAYTVRMSSGYFKNKTPVEVLMADPGAVDQLRNQYKYLRENLSKYPRNKEQMDAIEEAVELLKNGKLTGASAPAASASIVIPIYHAEARSLIRKPREDGMCPVYEVHIDWQTGANFPVSVNVVNFYAPVKKLEGGRINPVVSQKDNATYHSVTYKLAEWEWMNMCRAIKTSMHQFETACAAFCVKDADEADRLNRTEGAHS